MQIYVFHKQILMCLKDGMRLPWRLVFEGAVLALTDDAR